MASVQIVHVESILLQFVWVQAHTFFHVRAVFSNLVLGDEQVMDSATWRENKF